MAVSGRKAVAPITGWFDSDNNHFCDPCKTDGQNVKARGYCEDCQEYLCSSCFSYHRKTKALKHHKLHERSDTTSTFIDDKCPFHNTEIVKFFCFRHKELGCHDCMVLKHRTCELDYIPDTCKGIGDSKEYDDSLKMLELKIQAAENLEREISDKTTEADDCFNQTLKDIDDFESHLINRIKEMREKSVEKAIVMNKSNKNALKTAHEECSKVSSDMKQLRASLKDNKASGKEFEMYIAVKKAKSLADDVQENVSTKLGNVKIGGTFKRNNELERVITTETDILLEVKKRSIRSLEYLGGIDLRTLSDKHSCMIAGCSLISPDKLLLTDESNEKIKLFEVKNDYLIAERVEIGGPRGVALLSRDEVAIAMKTMEAVQIFKTDDDLSLVRTVKLNRQCKNVTYNQGKLYIVCGAPETVVITDLNGTVQTVIPLNTAPIHIEIPVGIAASLDSKFVYVSDYFSNNSIIVRLTTNGTASSIYKDKKIESPAGILSLEDGSLLVCCSSSGTVYRVSEDFKTGFSVLNGKESPMCICKDDNGDKMYIGCKSDILRVYKVVYH